jgi:3-oxoacyl-[acyl-carrier protein] reductase
MTDCDVKDCILLTGASSAIGSAIARNLAKKNISLALHYNHGSQRIRSLAEELVSKGCQTETFQCDLTADNAPKELADRVNDRLGSPMVLINNAGAVFGREVLENLSVDSWRQTFRLNAEVPFFLARELIPAMQKARYGRIINISSIGVKYGGSQNTLHYASSKGALETLSQGMSRLLAHDGISVNVVRPGFTKSNFHKELGDSQIESRIKMIPMGRSILPEETAAAVSYLLSPEASSVTGQTLSVSGGD